MYKYLRCARHFSKWTSAKSWRKINLRQDDKLNDPRARRLVRVLFDGVIIGEIPVNFGNKLFIRLKLDPIFREVGN